MSAANYVVSGLIALAGLFVIGFLLKIFADLLNTIQFSMIL